MIEESRELSEAKPVEVSLVGNFASKREKIQEALLNILEGRIQNANTRSAYKVAWRLFFEFCSIYKLELDRIKPYHFGLFLKRHDGSVASQRQHLAAIRLLFDHSSRAS
jgi:hypothetical protein